jgi:7,8-dihydropterin-6-yl-methyl-4-(beta-D-ribofuranosyl)aminobenzene 5'-phosphate synthase
MEIPVNVTLQPVDLIEITIVVDNSIDTLLPSTQTAQRAPLPWDYFDREPLISEHGYALLLTVFRNGRQDSILYDAGLGRNTAVHNLDVLGIQLTHLRAVVLSHGHADHHGGLEGIYQRTGRLHLPLVLHPDSFKERKVVFPTGSEIYLPPPNLNDLNGEGWDVIEERAPSLLLEDSVLVTGQVERTTAFEKGFPLQLARSNGGWEPDTWIWDDQAVVCNLKGQGLVILSSCSHAGAINIIRHAQRMTGVDHIHAFVGGFHLTGGLFEGIIPQTVNELVKINPDIIVPGHCTGWRATHEMARQLPEAFIPTSVGTRLNFAAKP